MSTNHSYTDEEKEWLRNNFYTLGHIETAKQFYELFGVSKSPKSLSAYCRTVLGCQSHKEFYTDAEVEWLKENFPKLGRTKASEEFSRLFNRTKKPKAIEKYCNKYLGIHVSTDRYKERYTERSKNVGAITKNCRGEWRVKTENGWKPLTHTVVDVPKGYIAIRLDHSKDNNDSNNIVAIPNGVHRTLMNANMWSNNPEITKTAIEWVNLYNALGKPKNWQRIFDEES